MSVECQESNLECQDMIRLPLYLSIYLSIYLSLFISLHISFLLPPPLRQEMIRSDARPKTSILLVPVDSILHAQNARHL